MAIMDRLKLKIDKKETSSTWQKSNQPSPNFKPRKKCKMLPEKDEFYDLHSERNFLKTSV